MTFKKGLFFVFTFLIGLIVIDYFYIFVLTRTTLNFITINVTYYLLVSFLAVYLYYPSYLRFNIFKNEKYYKDVSILFLLYLSFLIIRLVVGF